MKTKEIIFFVIKSVLTLVIFLTLILFSYAAFFYEPPLVERKITENEIKKNDKISDIEEEKRLRKEREQKSEESQAQEKTIEPEVAQTIDETQDKTEIKQTEVSDALFMTIGNRAITQSDVVNEIKILLILNNESYSDAVRDKLQKFAIESIIKRTIKEIEVDRNNFHEFNQQDLNNELIRLANNINVDVDTLKNICESNGLDFSIIENNIKIDLMWNSIIFQLYKDKLSINLDEIDESLKLKQNEKKIKEYLISEILIEPVEEDILESKIKELKNKIKIEGFENVAKSLSISESALSGGDLGWLNENAISEKIRSAIVITPVGELAEPILLPEGILFFKIRDKRKIDNNLSLEERKNQLVTLEKIKALKMHSLSHYDKLKRSTAIKFLQ